MARFGSICRTIRRVGWSFEITPTNHVPAEMGIDIHVNIYDPRTGQIFGDEKNQSSDGMDKPIIMIMCLTGHYEWLRLQHE